MCVPNERYGEKEEGGESSHTYRGSLYVFFEIFSASVVNVYMFFLYFILFFVIFFIICNILLEWGEGGVGGVIAYPWEEVARRAP